MPISHDQIHNVCNTLRIRRFRIRVFQKIFYAPFPLCKTFRRHKSSSFVFDCASMSYAMPGTMEGKLTYWRPLASAHHACGLRSKQKLQSVQCTCYKPAEPDGV